MGKLQEKVGIPQEWQRLKFGDKELKDFRVEENTKIGDGEPGKGENVSCTLAYYDIQKDARLTVERAEKETRWKPETEPETEETLNPVSTE